MRTLRIQKPVRQRWFPKIWAIVLASLLASGGIYFFLNRPPVNASFQVQNYVGDVRVKEVQGEGWREVARGQSFAIGAHVLTGPDDEVDLRLGEKVRVRLKGDSLLKIELQKLIPGPPAYRLRLDRGKVLIHTENLQDKTPLIVQTGPVAVRMEEGTLLAQAASETQPMWIGVLRGTAEQLSWLPWRRKQIHELQKIEERAGGISAPIEVSPQEWAEMKEAYELISKTAAMEAIQLDLAKEAGNFFAFVIDHGTFYTPRLGYCQREFKKDAGEAILEIEYDVFPTASFVGMYFKTRGLDISQYQSLRLDVRRVPDYGYPEYLKVELKSKGGVLRAFAIKDIKHQWRTVEFPLNIRRPTKVDEMTLVFAHHRVGEYKKGKVHLRNVTLIPRPEEQKAAGDMSEKA